MHLWLQILYCLPILHFGFLSRLQVLLHALISHAIPTWSSTDICSFFIDCVDIRCEAARTSLQLVFSRPKTFSAASKSFHLISDERAFRAPFLVGHDMCSKILLSGPIQCGNEIFKGYGVQAFCMECIVLHNIMWIIWFRISGFLCVTLKGL